jgi:hypothetical protein
VRYGHRKLAAELMDERAKTGHSFFGFLHRDVSHIVVVIVPLHESAMNVG